jgi:hypothetical protein
MYLFKSLHVYNSLCLFLSISIDTRVSFNICLNIFLSDSLSLYTYIYIHTVFYFFIISYFYFYIHINIYIEFLSKFTKYQSLSVCIYIYMYSVWTHRFWKPQLLWFKPLYRLICQVVECRQGQNPNGRFQRWLSPGWEGAIRRFFRHLYQEFPNHMIVCYIYIIMLINYD